MRKKLDMEKLKSKEHKIISIEEALKDVELFLTEEEIEEILKNKEIIKAEEIKIMNTRKVKVFKDNDWVDIEFENLKTDDKFKLFESTGEEVKDESGNLEFIAISDAYINKSNILTINILGGE